MKMDIYGVGVDIVNIKRIAKAIKKNDKFINRVFSKDEINKCHRIKNYQNCFAKRFAAKEAFSKALGTGISRGLQFKEILISSNNKGKPDLRLVGSAKGLVKKILKNKKFKVLVSLSDEKSHAFAMVVLLV